MDPKQFGAFIAQQRRELELTQAQLADRLHVTDKAVSRWERGLGFPDISTLEPLADALNLTIAELMKSEKCTPESISHSEVDTLLSDTLTLANQQRIAERRSISKITLCTAALLSLILLVDNITWMGFLGVYLPMFCLLAGIALLTYGFRRKSHGRSGQQTFLFAAAMLTIPVLLFATLFLVGALGLGPVPQ